MSTWCSVQRLIGREDSEYLLGVSGDVAEGVAQLRFHWSVWWEAEDCWLEDLYVAEDGGAAAGSAAR